MSPLDWAFLPLQRYVQFNGRAPRAEYWWFWLFQAFVSLATMLIDTVMGLGGPGSPISTNMILGLALFLPTLAVTVRRLHDVNRSGWVFPGYILLLTAIIAAGAALTLILGTFGIILMFLGVAAVGVKFTILMASEGSRGENSYGPNPYGLTYGY
jgi:uncharacterized membrane protein YhaH (DUF805 family)